MKKITHKTHQKNDVFLYAHGGRKAVRRKWRKYNKFTCDSSYWSSGFLISFLFLFFCFCFVHAFNDSFYVSHVVHKIRAEHRMSAKISFLHSVCRSKSLNQNVFVFRRRRGHHHHHRGHVVVVIFVRYSWTY